MIKNPESIFKQITHGVYVISVKQDNKKNAFTAAWVMQVSFEPLLLCFSINPDHFSYQLLKQSGICCISVLSRHQLKEAFHFGQSSRIDKMANHSWKSTQTGAPALSDALAYFDCKVDHFSDAGDHQLAICHVIDAEILNSGDPLLYKETENMDNSSDFYKK